MSDEEIERIKAKIEEDNRAIAALESKNAGKGKKTKDFNGSSLLKHCIWEVEIP